MEFTEIQGPGFKNEHSISCHDIGQENMTFVSACDTQLCCSGDQGHMMQTCEMVEDRMYFYFTRIQFVKVLIVMGTHNIQT
jgi:hypothetical protein